LDLSDQKTRRIVFREITKNAIINAIESPRTLDKNLVDAQQARRVLDRLVGYELSPILWKKVQRGLSAGRVQSVAVRLVVEREREIDQHKTETYYKTVAIFEVEKGKRLKAELSEKFETKEEAQSFLEECQKSIFKIQDLEKKPGYKKPSPPFTTSTLQQEAGRKLGYPVSVTMNIAQRLYESGKITYMRTDSLNLSETAIQGAKAEISKAYGSEFSEIRKFKTKSAGAQEAHEAIRPTDFGVHSIVGERNEQKLYDLIWKRAIASQMADAVTERTNVVFFKSIYRKYRRRRGRGVERYVATIGSRTGNQSKSTYFYPTIYKSCCKIYRGYFGQTIGRNGYWKTIYIRSYHIHYSKKRICRKRY
jgi:DNA topoisomerase-1